MTTDLRMKPVKIATAFLFLICVSALVTYFLLTYCHLFHEFGDDAKERILLSPIYAFCTTPILFWVAAYLCRRFSHGASGSNMKNLEIALAEVKDNLPPRKVLSFLSFRVVAICALSSLVATFGGGSLGREGPSVQMSASIFFVTAKRLRKFLPKISLESWIYAGVGTGLAVAFNAPIAGLICVCEKTFKFGSTNLISNMFWAALAVMIFLLISNESASLFTAEHVDFRYDIEEISSIFLIAASCGLVTYFFRNISSRLHEKFMAIESNKWHLIPIITGLLVSIISAYYGVYAVGGGITTVNDALGHADVFSSPGEVIGRIATTILTFISGSAGGLVAPSIAIGGGIGSVLSQFFTSLDPKVFIISGMVAFLGSTINLPITAAFIMFEAASQPVSALPFLLFSALIAILSAKFVTAIFQRVFPRKKARS